MYNSVIFVTEAAKKETCKFAKNFLPILFNLFTSGNPKEDGSVFMI